MSWLYLVEQLLNGLQWGLMLFLLSAGLTLILGIMNVINLAHGSLFMLGAYFTATMSEAIGGFWIAAAIAIVGVTVLGLVIERLLFRRLYGRDHLTQVLCTFALILLANELVSAIWGRSALSVMMPKGLDGPVELATNLFFPSYRLLIIAVGIVVCLALYVVVNKTRGGMWLRAGAADSPMARAMGVAVAALFTLVFGAGAALGALAGALLAPLLSVQIGMGENVLILCFVVVVIGGIGSIRGALTGALLVGIVDTVGRGFLPMLLREIMSGAVASAIGPALASVMIYILMAAILAVRPQGLFSARG
jgi:branched-chain amino acid transport system permease protein